MIRSSGSATSAEKKTQSLSDRRLSQLKPLSLLEPAFSRKEFTFLIISVLCEERRRVELCPTKIEALCIAQQSTKLLRCDVRHG